MSKFTWIAGTCLTGALMVAAPALGSAQAIADGSAWTGPRSIQIAAYSYTVYQIQSKLARLGYDPGPADGYMGSRTRTAIEAYQADNGLLVTGQASSSLLSHIDANLAQTTPQAQPEPAPAPTASSSGASTDLVINIQSELRQRGYNVPVISGQMDSSTEAAIRKYQADKGLLPDGKPSDLLLSHIRATPVGTAQTGADGQPVMSYRDQVRYVQQALNDRGYDAGPADGAMGPKTRTAIRTYESDAGLPITGSVTMDLVTFMKGETASGEQTTAEAEPAPAPETEPAQTQWETRFYDDFADGNYTANPRWNVYAGQFRVEQGSYLRSYVEIPAETAQGQQSGEEALREAGKALITGLLQNALGGQSQQQGAAPTYGEIAAAAPIGNAFDIEMQVSSAVPGGELVLGPYQGQGRNAGYRLRYVGGANAVIELLSLTSGGSRVVASSGVKPLEDGQGHVLNWRRNPRGGMRVGLDGQDLFRARDTTFSQDFSGFVLINGGGDFGLKSIRIGSPQS